MSIPNAIILFIFFGSMKLKSEQYIIWVTLFTALIVGQLLRKLAESCFYELWLNSVRRRLTTKKYPERKVF